MDIRFPAGVSEDFGFSDGGGARDAQNVRMRDPVTGRLRGAVRSGTSRYCSAQIAAAKVAHIATITTATTNQTLAALGNSMTQEWAKTNTVTGDTREVRCGTQGDVYSTDGNTGILKRNRDGATIWKLTLATEDKDHLIRALYVDASTPDNRGTDLVLAGVSSGGSSLTAKFWAYIQLDGGKVQKLWEITPGGYVEEFVISQDKLYALCNFPEKNRAYIIAYDGYLTEAPTEVRRWPVPYPANSITASPLDGFLFTASDANTNRDVLPGTPKSSMASEDWTIFDLPSYRDRVWANLDASNIDTLSITPRNLAYPGSGDTTAPPPDLLDGGNVLGWFDASGQGRNLYQTASSIVTGGAVGTEAARGAIFRRTGAANGGPCLHFDGVTTGMISEIPASTDSANKNENLSLLPSYKGAQFAVFIAGRFSADSLRRCVLAHGTTRWIGANKQASATIGDTAVPGSMALIEPNTIAGDAAASASVPTIPSGPGGNPLAGGLPDSGFAVLTWVCDGGVHDVFGTATRSLWRVNGHPCDRWQSASYSTTNPTTLGYLEQGAGVDINGLVGDIYQIVVLSDWADINGTQQYLLGDATGAKNYPDANWASAGDSYLERMEGWLAHRWSIAHELEGGKAGWLTMTATAAGAETVTVGATTYTFVAPPAATNDVAPGATTLESITNLARAINGTGTPTTDYWRAGVPNADFRASMPVAINATANTYAICVRSRLPNGSGVGAFAETLGAGSWNSANTSASLAGTSANTGWYPHPFYLERSNTSVGGPPRAAGAATTSKYWMLRSPHPILAAWDPANGRCKDALTSNYNDVSPTVPGAGSGVGGVGYCVRVTSTGQVFSCGPRAALTSTSRWAPNGFTADPVDARLIPWTAEAFSLLGTDYWMWGSGTTPASPGTIDYAYPRMAVDKFDNLYLPYFGTGSASLVCFALAGAGSGNPTVRYTYSGLTDANNAHACAIDPTYPDFTGFSSIQRAEFVLLATRVESAPTTRATLFKLRAISVTQAAGSPRTVKAVAVAGSTVATFTSGGTVTSIGTLDSARSFVDSAALFGKLYLIDGRQVKVYDPRAATYAEHVGTTSGGIPKRCSLIAAWNGSLVLARQAENPNQYFISAQGDPGDFDADPYTITEAQAITGSDGSAGIPPDIINAFIPYSDDLAFLGGDHTIFRLSGRPSPGGTGQIHLISDSLGIAFGRAWCKDTRGTLYFFGSRGGVYRMAPGGLPQLLPGKIERRLQNINLATYTVQMAWSDEDKGLHLAVCPFGTGGTVVEHYFWEEAIENWWPDVWQVSTIQPTCLAVMDGDAATDRVVLFGTEGGYVCKFNKSANADSTDYPIDSQVLWQISPKETPVEVVFSQLEAVMAYDQHASVWCNVYVTDKPDYVGLPVWSGRLEPGRNPFKNFKARGSFVFIELRCQDKIQRWAFEQMTIHGVTPAGRKRMVSK